MKQLLKKYKAMGTVAKAGIWFVFCNIMTKGNIHYNSSYFYKDINNGRIWNI